MHIMTIVWPWSSKCFTGVVTQPVADQHGVTPTIQQDVMLRPNQSVAVVGHAYEGKPGQRWRKKIKFPLQIFLCVGSNAGFQLIQAAPIQKNNRYIGLFKYNLQRTRQPALPQKTGTQ